VLTPEQRAVISLSEGRHAVLASPGTGKTEILAHRVVHALSHGVSPERMLCLTFTTRAAEAMRRRITSKLPPDHPLPEIGNIHQVCRKLLFNSGFLPPDWRVIDDLTREDLLRDLANERDGQEPHPIPPQEGNGDRETKRQGYGTTEEWNGEFLSCGGLPEWWRSPSSDFQSYKSSLHVLDFDDLLSETYRLFLAHPSRFPRYDWIQVDEIQDLTPAQWAIVNALSTPTAHCVFLGDSQQSVFSFMGASMPALQDVLATCHLHALSRNFRAASYLLDLSMRYAIRSLGVDFAPLPEPCPRNIARRAQDDLRLVHIPSAAPHLAEEQQAAWIARLLHNEFRRGVVCSTAVLVHSNAMAESVAESLERHCVPFYKISGDDLFTHAGMRDFKAYCQVFHDPRDRLAWARLLKRFGKVPTQKEARDIVGELDGVGVSPLDLLSPLFSSQNSEQKSVMEKHWRAIDSFRRLLRPLWRHMTEDLQRRSTYRNEFEVFVRYGIEEGLYRLEELDAESGERLDETILLRSEKFSRYTDSAYAGLCHELPFLDVLDKTKHELYRLAEVDLLVGDEPVVVATLHKAKGLEFERVILPCCEEGVYPRRGATPDERAEQARMLYVGLTRPKRQLLLLHSRTPSPFLVPVLDSFSRKRDVYRNAFGIFSYFGCTSDWLVRYRKSANARR